MAERAAWDFIESEKPGFTLTTSALSPSLESIRGVRLIGIAHQSRSVLGFGSIVSSWNYETIRHRHVFRSRLLKSRRSEKTSTDNVRRQFSAPHTIFSSIPETDNLASQDYVDVRDVARAHVGVVTHSSTAGKRYILAAGRMNNSLCANILRREFPSEATRIPDEPVQDFKPTFKMDNTP